ncbi:MAG: hypothetical protein RIQ93_1675 [Verrucomicrobiota bacterium]|jgi:hypothetical protein
MSYFSPLIVMGLFLTCSLQAQLRTEPAVKLSEVVVTPSRFGVAEEKLAIGASLTSAELETLPQIGDDLYRSIARLPGLAADDFTAKFWVRGAPNGELLARFDGVELLEPFHLKDVDGALSIVDPQAVRSLDLITGGFTSEYGNRLAAVLTIESKTPAAPRTSLGLSLTGLGGSHEGVSADQRGRWLVAARRGYPDVALKVANRDDDVSPRYWDALAKFEYQVTPTDTVSFHVLHAADTLRYERTNNPSLRSSYDSDYAWVRWRAKPAASVAGETVVSLARLTWNRAGSGRLDGFPFSLDDHRRLDLTSLRSEWSLGWGDRAWWRGGVEAQQGSSRYDYALSNQRTGVEAGRQIVVTQTRNARLRPDGSAFGGFVALRTRPWASLTVEPGVRYDRRNYTGDRDVSPRLNASLALGRATVRAAWGIYRQSEGLHELEVANGQKTFGPSERAEHRVIGIERAVGRGTLVRLEAYERRSTRLRPRWENLENPYDLFPEAQEDRVRLDPKQGRARGVEVLLSGRPDPRLTWNASYALARAEEQLGATWIPRARDQRHTFYADTTFAPNTRWSLSASWQYHSGSPTTDVVYSLAPLTNGRRLLVSANGPLYGLRLPAYHRLDLRATRRIHIGRGDLRVFLDVFNAYNHTNVVGFDHRVTIAGAQLTVVRKPREQLPLLPSAGVNWEF